MALNNLRLQIKSITSQTKLHLYCKHAFGLHTQASFVFFLDYLGNISFLLDEDNDLKEEIINLFNELDIFGSSTRICSIALTLL